MSAKLKTINVLSSLTLLAAVFLTTSVTAAAEKPAKDEVSSEVIQGAYYYVDGVEYEVPAEEVSDFSEGTLTTDLTNDPSNTEESGETSYKIEDPQRAYACYSGYEYDASKYSSGFKLGKSGTRVINQTGHALTEVSELESSATVSGTLSVTSGVSWGVIEGKVGFDMSASQTWTTSQSTSITVSPGYWGWIDYGSHTETWKGSYYYLSSTCTKSGVKSVTSQGPRYKAKLAKTARYPY